jgi:hypothetical protein
VRKRQSIGLIYVTFGKPTLIPDMSLILKLATNFYRHEVFLNNIVMVQLEVTASLHNSLRLDFKNSKQPLLGQIIMYVMRASPANIRFLHQSCAMPRQRTLFVYYTIP